MLSLGLIEAKKLGIDTVMISAHEDNPTSWRTIESCG
jgi:predicted acetyltransferase